MYQERAKTEMKRRVDLFQVLGNAFPSLPSTVSKVPIETVGLFEIEDKRNQNAEESNKSEEKRRSNSEEDHATGNENNS